MVNNRLAKKQLKKLLILQVDPLAIIFFTLGSIQICFGIYLCIHNAVKSTQRYEKEIYIEYTCSLKIKIILLVCIIFFDIFNLIFIILEYSNSLNYSSWIVNFTFYALHYIEDGASYFIILITLIHQFRVDGYTRQSTRRIIIVFFICCIGNLIAVVIYAIILGYSFGGLNNDDVFIGLFMTQFLLEFIALTICLFKPVDITGTSYGQKKVRKAWFERFYEDDNAKEDVNDLQENFVTDSMNQEIDLKSDIDDVKYDNTIINKILYETGVDIYNVQEIQIKEEKDICNQSEVHYIFEIKYEGHVLNKKKSLKEISELYLKLKHEFKDNQFPVETAGLEKYHEAHANDEEDKKKNITRIILLFNFILDAKLDCQLVKNFFKEDPTRLREISMTIFENNSVDNKPAANKSHKSKTAFSHAKNINRNSRKTYDSNITFEYFDGEAAGKVSRSPKPVSDMVYSVQLLQVIFKDEILKKTVYEFKVQLESEKNEWILKMTFSDFKNFHKQIINEIKTNKINTFLKFPNDQKSPLFSSKFSQKLVDYRKLALETYLQCIFNSPKLRSLQPVQHILEKNKIHKQYKIESVV